MNRPMLVGVTDSSASRRAVDWAATRAARTGSTVVLVRMLDSFLSTLDNQSYHEKAVASARELVAGAVQQVRAIAPDAEVIESLHTGSSVLELFSDLAKEHGAELVVVGSDTRGRAAQQRSRGTGSLRIAASAEVPVVIVPDIDLEGRRGVVVGVDGSDTAAKAFDFAVGEASARGEPLITVHGWFDPSMRLGGEFMIAETEAQTRQRVQEFVDELYAPHRDAHPGLEIDVRTVARVPADALAEAAENASLLVVGSHGRGVPPPAARLGEPRGALEPRGADGGRALAAVACRKVAPAARGCDPRAAGATILHACRAAQRPAVPASRSAGSRG